MLLRKSAGHHITKQLCILLSVVVLCALGIGEPENCIYHSPGQAVHSDRLKLYVHPVPRSIWQTYRTDELPNQAKNVAEKWLQLNPEYYYHFHNDDEASAFFEEHFDASTLEMIQNFPKGVMRADFWRYAIMYFYGGVYMDIDARPLKSLQMFKHYPFEEKRVVIGLENDEHLCQWGFISAPRHPLFATVLRVIRDVWEHDKVGKRPPDYEHFVHNFTGPTIFTLGVMNFLGVSYEQVGSRYYAKYLLDQYNTPGSKVRKICDEYAVVIEDQSYFQHGMIEHEYGSWSYGDGYWSWTSNTQKGASSQHSKQNNIRQLIGQYQKQSVYLKSNEDLQQDLEECLKKKEKLSQINKGDETENQKIADTQISEQEAQIQLQEQEKQKQLEEEEQKKQIQIKDLEEQKENLQIKMTQTETRNSQLQANNIELDDQLSHYNRIIYFLCLVILVLVVSLLVMNKRLEPYVPQKQIRDENHQRNQNPHSQIALEEDGI